MHILIILFFFFNDTATTEIYTLSLHDALPICPGREREGRSRVAEEAQLQQPVDDHDRRAVRERGDRPRLRGLVDGDHGQRSEEHTSELQSRQYLVCRLLLEKKKYNHNTSSQII